jgi:hypothetical protein
LLPRARDWGNLGGTSDPGGDSNYTNFYKEVEKKSETARLPAKHEYQPVPPLSGLRKVLRREPNASK